MRKMMANTYKCRIQLSVIGIVIVIALFGWGNFGHKNIDSLPSLEQIAEMEDEAELNSYISDFSRADLRVAWGEPDESGYEKDVWYIDDNTSLAVSYLINSDKAVVCGILRNE